MKVTVLLVIVLCFASLAYSHGGKERPGRRGPPRRGHHGSRGPHGPASHSPSSSGSFSRHGGHDGKHNPPPSSSHDQGSQLMDKGAEMQNSLSEDNDEGPTDGHHHDDHHHGHHHHHKPRALIIGGASLIAIIALVATVVGVRRCIRHKSAKHACLNKNGGPKYLKFQDTQSINGDEAGPLPLKQQV